MDKSLQIVCMYVLTHLGLIFFMYPTEIIASTDQAHWIPILIGWIIHFILISVYMKGLHYFPNKNIITIYRNVIGKAAATIFLLPTAIYFFIAIFVTIRIYSEIITIILLEKTPLWSIIALFVLISGYLAAQGIDAIFRTGVLLTILFLPLVFIITCIAFQNVDWHYIFPLIDNRFPFITNSNFYKSFYAFGGGFLFLGFVQSHLNFQRKKVQLAAIILFPFFLFSVYIPVLTFGQDTASTFLFPFTAALDGVNINWLMFDRVTLFFIMSLITFILLYLALVQWKMVQIVKSYVPFIKSFYLLVILDMIVFIICIWIQNWEEINYFMMLNVFIRWYIMILIPFSVYYFGMRTRRKSKNENKNV
ncbi:MAG TPA: GerAB/ArcD/ProY family transporter [Bacillus sp. (in: firmicutes)]|uniref:GerAB/ArcD/ProY family transporter n=1 Tax=Bacillus litorisediminis TaxID=2922713 RepID=UPI001FAF52F0|nr:GerAB/ArcD/ProY family transporter [Bacillus litorisediminis]HWO75167.1 GerAB/ArcD/ProY family transporter [Bacillus sp. (in: firmicutes)]